MKGKRRTFWLPFFCLLNNAFIRPFCRGLKNTGPIGKSINKNNNMDFITKIIEQLATMNAVNNNG